MKKKNVRRMTAFLSVLTVLCLVGSVVYSFFDGLQEKNSPKQVADKPIYESAFDREIVLPDEEDEEGMIELAVYLYNAANKSFQNCEKCAYFVNSVTDTMGLPVNGYRYLLKTQDEYYYTEYSCPGEIGLLKKAMDPVSTDFSLRSYTCYGRNTLYSEKALHPTVSITEEAIGVQVETDWDNMLSDYPLEEEVPIYSGYQDGIYYQTDLWIDEETVLWATVSYEEEEGYYRIEMELDTENPKTTEKTIDNVRAGSSLMKKANYTSVQEVIEIWDNGYFRYFDSIEKIQGGVELNIDFATYFHYDEEYLNPEAYSDFVEVKKHALGED